MQGYKNHKKLRKHDTSKGKNKSLINNHIKIELYELPDKEFKIIILKKFSELQENTDR